MSQHTDPHNNSYLQQAWQGGYNPPPPANGEGGATYITVQEAAHQNPPHQQYQEYSYIQNGPPPPPPQAPLFQGDQAGSYDSANGGEGNVPTLPAYTDHKVVFFSSWPPPTPHAKYMPAKDEINKAQPKFRDWWAAIAFLVVCGVFIWLSVLFLSALPGDMFKSGRSASQATNFYSWPTVVMVLIFIVIGFLVSVIYLMAIQHASEFIINMSYTLVVAAMLAGAIYYLVARVWFAGALLLAGGLLTGYLWFKYWRHYVKFTSAILKAVCRVFWKFTSTLWASFVFLVVACGFSILWALVLAGSLKYFSCETDTSSQGVKHKVCKEGASKVLSLIYLVFAYYWIVQVLSGVLYTTICGVFGTHFFFPDGQYPYKNPLLSSLRRATTYSFGSVCFGSLILAIIQTIRLMIKNMQSETSDFLCGVVLCIIQCILGGIQWLAEFITEYAYVDVALFGNSFVTASKRTNELMESSGMRMVANDCLVDSVLFCGGLLCGTACAVAGYVYVAVINPAYNVHGSYTAPIVIMAFVMGVFISGMATTVISAGTKAMLVCITRDPYHSYCADPQLAKDLAQTRPEVFSIS